MKITLEFCYPNDIREGSCFVSYKFEDVSVRGLDATKDFQDVMKGLFRKLWKVAYGKDMTDEEYNVIVQGQKRIGGKSPISVLSF